MIRDDYPATRTLPANPSPFQPAMLRPLFLLLLTLVSTPPAHSDESGLCTSVCVTEQGRCQKNARSMDRVERDGWAYHQDVRMGSDASAEMERLAARQAEVDKRRSERDADCETAYGRCMSDCRRPR